MLYLNGRFLTQPMTGVQRFAYELSVALVQLFDDLVILVPSDYDVELYPDLEQYVKLVDCCSLSGHFWEQMILPLFLKKKGYPLLLNLSSTSPVRYKNSIYTLHDVAVKKFPKSFSFAFRTLYGFLIPKCLKIARCILTVSDFSKQEIIRHYGVAADRIFVVHNAVSLNLKANVLSNDEETRPYLLAVSSLNPQKNFKRLIEAFLSIENLNCELRIVGAWNKSFKSNLIFERATTNSKIKFLGRVSDIELMNNYSQALAFIFPSIYEGFGIPVIEAQSLGCPVLASNIPPLIEVLGDSALYCDPLSVSDIKKRISQIVIDDELRGALRDKGFINQQRFSWHKSAEKIYNIYLGLKN